MIRDAYVDRAWSGSCEHFAVPPGRALLLAVRGADSLAHVLYAPAGLALGVLVALVQKAAFAGGTLGPDLRLADVEDQFLFLHHVRQGNHLLRGLRQKVNDPGHIVCALDFLPTDHIGCDAYSGAGNCEGHEYQG